LLEKRLLTPERNKIKIDIQASMTMHVKEAAKIRPLDPEVTRIVELEELGVVATD
jgi:hypothetical protein